jgi:NAD(P)-dependent dehydrogenase (short-subunit alcohol dehydrogenase family)
MTLNSKLIWLITGCSTGFGRALAEHLLDEGHGVVVTARKVSAVADLADRGDAFIVPLDVTDRSQCDKAVAEAIEHFGRIDVLMNNAGIGYFGAVEETSLEASRLLMDVNFFGAANMIHAVLPSMRTRRSGFIVNLTSIGGLAGFTAVGYYSASKFALEGLSETLRREVEPLGISVMTVEPSGFRTEWAGGSSEITDPVADYAPTAGAAREAYHQSVGNQAGDPARAASAILKAVTHEAPPQRLLLGNEAVEVAFEKLEYMKAEFTAWEDVARQADFPAK